MPDVDSDFSPSDLLDLPILRRRKPGPVPWEELDVDPADVWLPPPPKPGPPTWEGLIHRQFRIRRMAYLFIQGYSLRAIAKDLGVARTTVDRMKPDMAQFNLFARTPSAPAERAPGGLQPATSADRLAIRRLGVVVHEYRPVDCRSVLDRVAPRSRLDVKFVVNVAQPDHGCALP